MKDVSWTELKRMNLKDIADGPCLRITEGWGTPIVYIITKPQQAMVQRVEALCGLIDAGKG